MEIAREKYIKGNKIICSFMGEKYEKQMSDIHHEFYQQGYRLFDFNDKIEPTIFYKHYHSSWDCLLPVVDKISEYRLAYPEQANKVCECKVVVCFARLYELVIEFIEWYNTLENKI